MSESQATLPEDMEGESLGTMMTGEIRWTLPWAMWADSGRRLWLHPHYPAKVDPAGTAVMRVDLLEDGYHVWRVRGQRYAPQEPAPYVSDAGTQFLPVAVLH